jgi:hypothetical protein
VQGDLTVETDAPESGGSPKIPFRKTVTWGAVAGGIKAAFAPDVGPKVVTGNLVFLLVILVLTVCKSWSLVASGHCGDVFQGVSPPQPGTQRLPLGCRCGRARSVSSPRANLIRD